MTTFEYKQLARACNCLTCKAALHNLRSALRWFARAKSRHEKAWARRNYHYFIRTLREISDNPDRHVV